MWTRRNVILSAVVGVCLTSLIGVFVSSRGLSDSAGHVYVFDMTTGTLHSETFSPELRATRIIAHIFSCTGCDDETSRFGFLERVEDDLTVIGRWLPGAPDSIRWLPFDSSEAARLADVDANCPSGEAYACLPD